MGIFSSQQCLIFTLWLLSLLLILILSYSMLIFYDDDDRIFTDKVSNWLETTGKEIIKKNSGK